MMRRAMLACAMWVAACMVASSVEAARFRPNTGEIDRGMQGFLQARSIPSIAVGVYDQDGLIWANAYGYSDKERRTPATSDTPYQIGSITKLFTASLILQLRDEQRLRLDDQLHRWFDGQLLGAPSTGALGAVTIRDLLTHSSGLPANPVNRVDADGVMQPYSRGQLIEGLRGTDLAQPRGTKSVYSNLGYGILGYIAERTTGGSYEEALQKRLLQPLGIDSTSIALTPAREAALARHYWFQDKDRRPRSRWVFGEVAAFGGLTSTVPDLARFFSFQMRRDSQSAQVLAAATRAEMQRPHIPWIPGYDLGYGWQVWHSRGLGDILTHGGEVDGHGSYAAFSPGIGVGVVLLTNLGGPTSTDLGDWLLAKVVESARGQILPTIDQAKSFSAQEDWANAAWAWRAITRAGPKNGDAFYRLGLAEFNLDRFDRALEAWEQARSLEFDRASVAYMSARAFAVTGDRPAALGRLNEAVRAGFRAVAPLESHPEFEMLKSDPAWPAILRAATGN